MRRLAVAIAIILGLGMAPSVIGAAADTAAVAKAAAISAESDFNNDGFSDLAIGIPGQTLGTGTFSAGAVSILYGRAAGLTGAGSQYLTQNTRGVSSTAEPQDRFGSTLAAGDFNNDGFADLAISVPQESIGLVDGAGAVNVLYGSAAGLTGSGSQYFNQDTSGVGSSAERNDHFGGALATSDFNNDGFADLAIGAPGEDSSVPDVGAVNVLYGGTAGLTGAGSHFFTQNTPGVGDNSEFGDTFGAALTGGDFNHDGFADLAIGVYGEGVGSIAIAGAVNVLYGTSAGLTGARSQYLTQNTPGVGNNAEELDQFGFALTAGDFDNDGFADLVIGVPQESTTLRYIGAVNVLYGTSAGLTGARSQYLSQNTPGVGNNAEELDQFGRALTAGDFDHDGISDLVVGVPWESIRGISRAGAVNVLYGSAAGLTGAGSQYFTQDNPGVGSSAEEDDLFGLSLAAGDLNDNGFADLTIGVPNESGSLDAIGAINVLYGAGAGLTGSGSQFFTQDSPGVVGAAEEGDQFGTAVAASGP